jgi:cytochrome P450
MGPRREITLPMFGDGILTQKGDKWRCSRKMLSPQLHPRHYENLEVFQTPLDDLIDRLLKKSGVVDLQPLFFRLTLDTTTAFLFGESVRSPVAPGAAGERTFATAFDTAQRWVTNRFRLSDVYWLVDGNEFREACRDVHTFADQLINRNLSEKKSGSFLNAVANSTPNREAFRGQIVNLLTGGRDTTACLLSWTLYVHRGTYSSL